MPTYRPVEPPMALPAEQAAFEAAMLDLKGDYANDTAFHMAKDVAAFANHLGGTVLVGARETNGRVGIYSGLTEQQANDTQDAISRAVRDRCSPRPFLDFARYTLPTGALVLAVNVPPYIDALIAVSAKSDKGDGYGGTAWTYPVRSGSHSAYLLPEQLAMLSTPQVRRAIVLLSKIPPDMQCDIRRPSSSGGYHQLNMFIHSVVPETNSVLFASKKGGPATDGWPLDQLRTAYCGPNGEWYLYFEHHR